MDIPDDTFIRIETASNGEEVEWMQVRDAQRLLEAVDNPAAYWEERCARAESALVDIESWATVRPAPRRERLRQIRARIDAWRQA